MEDRSSVTSYRETKTTKSTAANGSDVSLKPGVDGETYNKVHHDLDAAAAHRKPIVTESKYKVKVAEPGVETLPLADHDHVEGHGDGHVGRKSERTGATKISTHATTSEKPDVHGEKSRGRVRRGEGEGESRDESEESDGGFNWWPLLGGAAAIAGVIAGVMFYRKRNPEVDVKIRRSVEDADHRVKGAFGSGERKVKELIGSGQQKFNNLIHRGEHNDYQDEGYDSHGHGHGHSHNPLNVLDGELYQVKKGDNLTKIARKSGKKSWQEIAEKNPSIRNPDLIYAGDRLKV